VREKLSVQVRELSLGQRMKMELIASLLHQPRVLFLDEPTLGLDVVSQQTVRHFLRDYSRRQQTTILLTSHYMADIEALCQRVIIIDRGALYFDGPLESIVDQFADFKLVTLQCEDAESVNLQTLSRHGEIVEEQPGKLTLKIKRDRVIPACKSLLDELIVKDIDIHEVPIEEVVRQIFSRQNPDAPTTPSKGYPAL
jgi:ABC-2 type transport system ATP-binding protein